MKTDQNTKTERLFNSIFWKKNKKKIKKLIDCTDVAKNVKQIEAKASFNTDIELKRFCKDGLKLENFFEDVSKAASVDFRRRSSA